MALQIDIDYVTSVMVGRIENLTDAEFDPQLWRDDPDIDSDARTMRDIELVIDLTGNLDSCA